MSFENYSLDTIEDFGYNLPPDLKVDPSDPFGECDFQVLGLEGHYEEV